MGSKSSSATQTTENVTTTNKNISGLAENAQAFADVGMVNINTVDDVIVDRAFDFGDSAFKFGDSAYKFGGSSLDFAGDGLSDILDFGGEIIEGQQKQLTDTLSSINAANATGATLTDVAQADTIKTVVKYVAIAAIVIGAGMVYKKVRK